MGRQELQSGEGSEPHIQSVEVADGGDYVVAFILIESRHRTMEVMVSWT